MARFPVGAARIALAVALCAVGAEAQDAPAPVAAPVRLLSPGLRADLLQVKLRDGLPVRARAGRLVQTDGGDGLTRPGGTIGRLNAQGLTFQREFGALTEEKLELLRAGATKALGRPTPDLNLHLLVRVPEGMDTLALIKRFGEMEDVEHVEPAPVPLAPPVPPDFTSLQGYRSGPPIGIGVTNISALPGGTGVGVAFADIEYSWNTSHGDLPAVTLLGPPPVDPFSDLNHGTAVLGEIVGKANGFGVTGLAPDAPAYVVAANTSFGYSVGGAVLAAAAGLPVGSVILIEQQTAGPNYTGNPPGTQFGLVPVEWNQSTYSAIVTAVANGFIVVEAAGNGGQNLDDAIYSFGNGGHYPFRPENDSGAIIVGAGAWGGSGAARSRLSFSCYGSTVDMQGWGEQVTTSGYGGLYSSEGPDQLYTSVFSGTSSASPIVASACILLQAYARATTGVTLKALEIRSILTSTGSPQSGSLQHIGPLPDLVAAFIAFAPSAPGAFSLVSPQDGAVDVPQNPALTWTNATLALLYTIDIDDAPDFATPIFSGNAFEPSFFYAGPPLVPGNLYYWRVACSNNLGTTQGTPAFRSFQVAYPAPGPFQLGAPADDAQVPTRRPVFSWSTASGADSYTVELDDSPDFATLILAESGLSGGSWQAPPGLLLNHGSYVWRVRAIGPGGTTTSTPSSRAFSVQAPACPGDADLSGFVNFGDITSVLTNWGSASTPGAESPGDANQDGAVNFVDITTVLVNWVAPCP